MRRFDIPEDVLKEITKAKVMDYVDFYDDEEDGVGYFDQIEVDEDGSIVLHDLFGNELDNGMDIYSFYPHQYDTENHAHSGLNGRFALVGMIIAFSFIMLMIVCWACSMAAGFIASHLMYSKKKLYRLM